MNPERSILRPFWLACRKQRPKEKGVEMVNWGAEWPDHKMRRVYHLGLLLENDKRDGVAISSGNPESKP